MITTDFADLVVEGETADAVVAEPAALQTPVETHEDLTPDPAPDVVPEPVRNEDGTYAQKGKGKEPYQSKVGRLKSEAEQAAQAAAEAKADAERYRAEVEQLKAQRPAPAPVSPVGEKFTFADYDVWAAEPGNDGRPWEEYQDERAEARLDWRDARKAYQQQQEQALSTKLGLTRTYLEREASIKTTVSDYDTVMQRNIEDTQAGRVPLVTEALRDAIFESEVGPRLAYYLAQHPEQFVQVNGLRGTALAKAVGKLEARLETVVSGLAQAIPVKPKPAPISPLGGGPANAAESPSDDDAPDVLITADWVRRENQKDRERGRVR